MEPAITLDELRDHFELLDGWEERYRYIIDLGRKLQPMEDVLKNDVTKVDGCMSQVWMTSHLEDGRLHFKADSDASIVRGLIAVLMVAYDDRTPAEISALDIGPFFDVLGLAQHVSMNRRNGFFAMVGRIQGEARRAASGPEFAGAARGA